MYGSSFAQHVRIDLGDRSYDIAVGTGLLGDPAAFEVARAGSPALIVTTDAVIRMARNPSTRATVNRLRKISIVEGGRASVTFSRGELRVVVDPSKGIVGRPSSAVVIRTMAGD